MKFGIFPTEGGRVFEDALTKGELAERLGYDSYWINDHQATEGENYWPAPLLRLGGVAARTESLRLVTAVLILPLYHPLHVAQRTAMLDLMSGGRVTLGVGLGYVEEEFDAFGVPMAVDVGLDGHEQVRDSIDRRRSEPERLPGREVRHETRGRLHRETHLRS